MTLKEFLDGLNWEKCGDYEYAEFDITPEERRLLNPDALEKMGILIAYRGNVILKGNHKHLILYDVCLIREVAKLVYTERETNETWYEIYEEEDKNNYKKTYHVKWCWDCPPWGIYRQDICTCNNLPIACKIVHALVHTDKTAVQTASAVER